MSWDRVHEEAEVLEHAISPALFGELIAAKPETRPTTRTATPPDGSTVRDRRDPHAGARRP